MVTHALYRFRGRRPQRSCHSHAIVGRACTATVTSRCWCPPCSHAHSSTCQVSPLRMAPLSPRSGLCTRKPHASSGASIWMLLCVTCVCPHPCLSLHQCALVALILNSELELEVKLLSELSQCWLFQWFPLVPLAFWHSLIFAAVVMSLLWDLRWSRLIGRVPASSKNQPFLPGALVPSVGRWFQTPRCVSWVCSWPGVSRWPDPVAGQS